MYSHSMDFTKKGQLTLSFLKEVKKKVKDQKKILKKAPETSFLFLKLVSPFLTKFNPMLSCILGFLEDTKLPQTSKANHNIGRKL